MDDLVIDIKPLFHWSPNERRLDIQDNGLTVGNLSVDGLWRPDYLCFADSPSLAWSLSGDFHRNVLLWDLWMVWDFALSSVEKIIEEYTDTGRPYVKEYRIRHDVPASDLWYVATRINIHD